MLRPHYGQALIPVPKQGQKGGKPEDFHGKNIPVDGETVAHVVRERLAVPLT